jgi:hypothetical protein
MRVIQENEVNGRPVWGWSSPVWVNNLNLDSSLVTGVNPPSQSVGIDVYPNPAASPGVLTLDLDPGAATDIRISLVDSKGAVISAETRSLPAGRSRVDLALGDLPRGAYFVRLTTPGGGHLGSTPFIVQ